MKIYPYYQRQKDSPWFVDFIDVQIVHKFPGRVTSNLHFKVTIFSTSNISKMVKDTAILPMAGSCNDIHVPNGAIIV